MPEWFHQVQIRRFDAGGQVISQYLLLAALLVAAVTYWAPWVDHDAAALRLTGQDMGEFVKFLPISTGTPEDVRGGQAPRQLYYVPPFVCAVCLTLLAANHQLVYPRWLRVIVLVCAALLLFGLLPPAWGHPKELLSGEFRLQGYSLLFGLALVLAHGLFRRIPIRVLAIVVIVLSLIALLGAQVAFWLVRPRLWAAYNTPTLSLGWGLWLHIASWVAAMSLGVYIYQWTRVRQTSIQQAFVRE
jgi:hypothetical protein